jgi:hypothetical protein
MEENIDEITDDEEIEEIEDDGHGNGNGDEAAPEPSAPAAEGDGAAVESSLEELLAKREGGATEEEEDDDSMLAIGRDERLEPLAVKVVPPTDKEFVCKNCHLVKHRSQLADRDRMLCRDCA